MNRNGSKYIMCKDHTWSVVGKFENLKDLEGDLLADGKAYLGKNDGYVRIYCKSKPMNPNRFPYFWVNESSSEIEFSHPSHEVMNIFREENIVSTGLDEIAKHTKPDDVLYDEQALNDMNASTKLFRPVIKDTDDFLKKLVKTVIIEKEIDINRLKSRMTKAYSLPNMTAALKGTTKMSVSYFQNWMEILGCDFQVAVLDNGSDTSDPLKDDLLYDSSNGNVTNISK